MNQEPLKVLIVDDQEAVLSALTVLFEIHDVPYVTATTPESALEQVRSHSLGVVVQDMNFRRDETSGAAGIELFRQIREAQPGVPILLMTAWASLETAVELVREGAADYLQKPWNDEKLLATVENLLRMRRLELENEALRSELRQSRQDLAEDHDLRGLVYASEAMHRVVSLAVSVADSEAPVMITGASGSGKEKIAEIVQANSRRSDRPFVKVNVGALPEELLEAELFGAEAGAFTGSRSRRIGHFETADGGTLFLDEVDSLSLQGQVKLLRVLQSGEFQRLGSSETRRVDVRVLSATNSDLSAALAAGRFREDLFFRLNVVEIKIPGLDQRQRDILPLARHFLEVFARREGAAPKVLGEEAERALLGHSWSGNVRELQNRVQRATVVAQEREIRVSDLGLEAADSPAESDALPADLAPSELEDRARLVQVLAEEGGVVTRVAERLGLSRQALYRRMARLGIELERRPKV
ncbi:MAG: sigma-54 dependent transcriptional regulator [Acidobacteriota bacterium]